MTFRLVLKKYLSTAVMITGILAVRSTLAEPYRVPSGSMEPTILPGDFLMVSKAEYELKIPFTETVVTRMGSPERGDVIVFRYPKDPSVNFVKRLIGLPGDLVEVTDGLVRINGRDTTVPGAPEAAGHARLITETLGANQHLVQKLAPPRSGSESFRVPEGEYFFMGDNRDNSNDSRFWGFVPKSALRGKVRFVWLSVDWEHGLLPSLRFGRIGTRI